MKRLNQDRQSKRELRKTELDNVRGGISFPQVPSLPRPMPTLPGMGPLHSIHPTCW